MEPFPCPLERSAASALLLLSLSPPKLNLAGDRSLREKDKSEIEIEIKKSLSLVSTDSRSSSSTLSSEGSSAEIRAHRLRIIAVVARCQEMKLKVVQKSSSKIDWSSDRLKNISGKPATKSSESVSTEASCLSSSSSAVSSARSWYATRARGERKLAVASAEWRKKCVGSTHIQRRAEAILNLLCGGYASEGRIRKEVGDSPDTSKALRMLLKLEEVKRSGIGGRQDPYIYTIARGSRPI